MLSISYKYFCAWLRILESVIQVMMNGGQGSIIVNAELRGPFGAQTIRYQRGR